MESQIIIIAVLGALVLFFALKSLGGWAGKWLDALQGLRALAEQIRLAREETRDVPKFLQGQIKTSLAMCEQIDKLTQAVDKFAAVVTGGKEPGKDVLEPYDPETADRKFAAQQYMAEGLNEEEAKVRVDIDEQSRLYHRNPAL